MKRNKNHKFIMIVILMAIISCDTEAYLNEPEPTTVVTEKAIYGSEDGVRAFFSGIYRRMRRQWGGDAGATGTTDIGGVYSWYFARANKGSLFSNTTWYLNDYKHKYREATFRRVWGNWSLMYYQINQLNNLIQGVESNKDNIEQQAKRIKLLAEARGLRAYYYFQLALDYMPAYEAASDYPAPPIYKNTDEKDLPMSKSKDLYKFINEDLDYALANLTEERVGKYQINLTVAKGIKVRVLMAMNKDWPQIISMSQDIYKSIDDALEGDYKDGFSDASREDWLWAMIQSSEQTAYYYAAPHSFSSSNGYNNIFMNDEFINTFDTTDVRYTFLDTQKNTAEKKRDFKRYRTIKYKFSFESDMLIMRKAEFLLSHIEGLYHTGKESEASNLLYQMQKKRNPKAIKSTNTGASLLEEILLERKKEHYIEFGVEYFDNRRLQRGLERKGNHQAKVTLEPNDVRWFLKIPQKEIDANPNIGESVNLNR